MQKQAADKGATVTRATAFDILHTSFPKHSSGISHTHADPALPLVTGALPDALCTLMTSKHFHGCPAEGQVSGSA